jgi:pimeloyl-ACP methyl ester carboxylesterase
MSTATERGSTAPGSLFYLTDYARSFVDLELLFCSTPVLAGLPGGDGHPVLVLPGLLASDSSTSLLRAILRGLGYRAYGWRLGRNVGPTAQALHGMRARLDQLVDRHGRPVSLIGWSLGGIYARQLARSTPDAVRQVVTLGSPFRLTSPEQSRAHPLFRSFSDLGPLPVPSTAIYSRLDGIVAWQACRNASPTPRTENIAVPASHLGFGHHPMVIWAVADRLAQPEGQWTPFRSPPALWPLYRGLSGRVGDEP